jgi:hypothetical protein
MNPQEAKQILLLYRPGTADAADPEISEALKLAQHDPELGRWFDEHRAFQQAMRDKFRQTEVPAHLKTSLLIRGKAQPGIVIPQVWCRRPAPLAIAAAAALMLAAVALWLQPPRTDRFANFQSRMVGTALREYRMDLVTNDMRQVRQFLADRGAPADYDVTEGLGKLQLTGAGLLRWRSNPVSMVCFNRGDNQMLFLFVMNRSALKDPPPEIPQLAKVADLVAASWSRGDKVYLLAGPEESGFGSKYLPPNS